MRTSVLCECIQCVYPRDVVLLIIAVYVLFVSIILVVARNCTLIPIRNKIIFIIQGYYYLL